jgi:hypothetical protein
MDARQFDLGKIALSVQKGTQACAEEDTNLNLTVSSRVGGLVCHRAQGKGDDTNGEAIFNVRKIHPDASSFLLTRTSHHEDQGLIHCAIDPLSH